MILENVALVLAYVGVLLSLFVVGGVFADAADRRDARRRNHVSRRRR